ncbi:3974_t:CDS:2 [Scutellospora calospora]|uniref:3974_t:CDS:1 n=1 Tax=Scutellospora calospora TaxID=85575 RepID=A0ACA9KKZ5_9GLOM|nr:3974_t:CDS:2 [Scutellospora calospora]
MNKLLLYCAACLKISEFNNIESENNVLKNNFTEDLNDHSRILLSNLLENVNYNDIKEI